MSGGAHLRYLALGIALIVLVLAAKDLRIPSGEAARTPPDAPAATSSTDSTREGCVALLDEDWSEDERITRPHGEVAFQRPATGPGVRLHVRGDHLLVEPGVFALHSRGPPAASPVLVRS